MLQECCSYCSHFPRVLHLWRAWVPQAWRRGSHGISSISHNLHSQVEITFPGITVSRPTLPCALGCLSHPYCLFTPTPIHAHSVHALLSLLYTCAACCILPHCLSTCFMNPDPSCLRYPHLSCFPSHCVIGWPLYFSQTFFFLSYVAHFGYHYTLSTRTLSHDTRPTSAYR